MISVLHIHGAIEIFLLQEALQSNLSFMAGMNPARLILNAFILTLLRERMIAVFS